MNKCAFLTMKDLQGFVTDDALLLEPLKARGWEVLFVPWQAESVDWGTFDAVLIRSTWDYQKSPDSFLRRLHEIENADTILLNPIELVRWNMRKTYLGDLFSKGVLTVPTRFVEKFSPESLKEIFNEFSSEEIILKPVVGANSDNVFRLSADSADSSLSELSLSFEAGMVLAQPFRWSVIEEGEFSLVFFGDELSHCIVKKPAAGDFRTQEEHGARILAVDDAPAKLIDSGRSALSALPAPPLYSRVDFVRGPDGEFELMECELVEPSLYFRMHPGAPELFVNSFISRLRMGSRSASQSLS